jgi:hypothetical protein
MPVPLPPAPTGGLQLPEESGDPPSLEDVYNAVKYCSTVTIDHGKLQSLQFPSNETLANLYRCKGRELSNRR